MAYFLPTGSFFHYVTIIIVNNNISINTGKLVLCYYELNFFFCIADKKESQLFLEKIK